MATLPVLVPDGDGEPRPVCIPNTVALVRGGANPGAAEALADHLLSDDIAVRLADGPSRQVPLGGLPDGLPPDVREFRRLADDAVDLGGLLPHRAAVLDRLAGASA